jgi:hypothetical protein
MPDEQIIYLDPNDELTSVRAKIEEIRARHITMVVPQQTVLRSTVGWRLLHARARELGKDVLVISPDRQVRALAKAAGFRVSQPSEGSSGSRTRTPPSQHQRNVAERKEMQRQRQLFNRGGAGSQVARRRGPTVPPPLPVPEDMPTEIRPSRNTWIQQENPPALPEEAEEPTSRQGKEDSYPPIEIIEDNEFDQPYEYRIDEGQAQTARPLTAHPDEEEQPDPFIQDYNTARRIREAAQEGASRPDNSAPEAQEPASSFPSSHFSTPPEPSAANPFEGDIEELSPSLLPEQRGVAFSPDVDDIAPDVADIPTEEHKIEDVEEPFDSQDYPVRQWENQFLSRPDESAPALANDTGIAGGRRSGKLPRTFEEEDADFLPPADQSTVTRPNRLAPSGPLSGRRSGSRGAQGPAPRPAASQQPAARNVTTRPIPQSPRAQQAPVQSPPITRSRIPAAPPPRRTRQASGRSGRAITFAVVAGLVLLLLIGGSLIYFGTTATVTLTVPSKSISLKSFDVVASTSTQSKFPNSVASQVLTDHASVSGTGTATGHTSQGNAVATGIVNFTNNGSQLVTVPSGTMLTTNAGAGSISFVTTATAVIPLANSGTTFVPIPVKAQNAGSSGNVAANTITVVPPASLTAIAQASTLSTSQLNLSVTNPAPLTGGGAAQVSAVTQDDLQALKKSLHTQLQAQLKAWLQSQLHQGDVAGKFFPNVVDSAQPLSEEQLTQVPAAGTALPGKTFSGTLNATVNVLVVRHNTLVAAAQRQLDKTARGTGPTAYTLSTQSPDVKILKSSPAADGKSITITMSASGLEVLQVDSQAVSAFLAGKTKDQAISAVSAGDAGPRGVEKVDINISPSFLSIMPFRPDHIHVVVKAGPPVKG